MNAYTKIGGTYAIAAYLFVGEDIELTELLCCGKATANIMPLISPIKQTYQTILSCNEICLRNTATEEVLL